MPAKVFIQVNGLNITCGVSSHLFYLLKELGGFARENIILISGGGSAYQKFETLVNRLIIEPEIEHEQRSLTGFLKGVIRLRKLITQFKPSVIHSHHFYAANLAAFARGRKSIKTIQSVHGLIPESGILPHYNADLIIAVNDHIVTELSKKLNPSKRIVLVRYGYPFTTIEKKLDGSDKLKVITGSRLIADKGIDTLLHAIELLRNNASHFTFEFAGSGLEEERFKEQASGMPVTFLGEVTDLVEKLDDYDIIVNPTRSQMEGFPTIIIQGASRKLAVISTKFRGYESRLSDTNSLLTEVDDAQGIADALLLLHSDRKLLVQKQEKIFEDFRVGFDIKTAAGKFKALYSGGWSH